MHIWYVPGRLPRISAAVIFHDVDAWRHRHATPPEIRAGSAKKKKKGNSNKKESIRVYKWECECEYKSGISRTVNMSVKCQEPKTYISFKAIHTQVQIEFLEYYLTIFFPCIL